jgi:hypothetical protein
MHPAVAIATMTNMLYSPYFIMSVAPYVVLEMSKLYWDSVRKNLTESTT